MIYYVIVSQMLKNLAWSLDFGYKNSYNIQLAQRGAEELTLASAL